MIKKVIGLLAVLIVAGSLTVLGENNNFVPSITTKDSITIAGDNVTTNTDRGSAEAAVELEDGCSCIVVLTTFRDRNKLEITYKDALNNAYDQILAADLLTALTVKLDEIVTNMNVNAEDLVVSDLFDVHLEEITLSGNHNPANNHSGVRNLSIKTSSTQNFVSLLHFKDGVWETISDAHLESDLQTIAFTSDSLSPFAVVLKTNRTPGGNGGNGSGGDGGYHVPNTGVK